MSDNEKVKLENNGRVTEFEFLHALNILRQQKGNIFKCVGNHEFINNELIIKPSNSSGNVTTKLPKGKKGGKVHKPLEDSDRAV